jgi:predicted MFS family arabinose efflux permease
VASPAAGAGSPGTVRNRAVGALVAAEIVSILGSRMTYLALPWFVLVTTGSPSRMTLVLAVQIAPMALLGIPSGLVVERLGARTAMLVCDAARAPLLAAVPLLHGLGLLTFPLLLALVAALGCFMAPYFAAQRVVLPELVGEDERTVTQANSLVEGGAGFAALGGPALAGLLIPFLGAANVLYVDAATYLVAFLLVLFFVPQRRRVAATVQRGVLAGVGFLMRERLLGPVAGVVVVTGFLSAGLSAALPVYAHDVFSGDARVAGLLYASLGAGALVGSVIAVLAVRRIRPLRLAAGAVLCFALPLWVLPLQPPVAFVVAALFAATLFAPLVNGPIVAVLTARTPEGLRARVITAVIAVNTLAAPGGFLVAGQVLERWGVVPVFAGVAGGMSLAALAFAAIVLRAGGEPAPDAAAVPA